MKHVIPVVVFSFFLVVFSVGCGKKVCIASFGNCDKTEITANPTTSTQAEAIKITPSIHPLHDPRGGEAVTLSVSGGSGIYSFYQLEGYAGGVLGTPNGASVTLTLPVANSITIFRVIDTANNTRDLAFTVITTGVSATTIPTTEIIKGSETKLNARGCSTVGTCTFAMTSTGTGTITTKTDATGTHYYFKAPMAVETDILSVTDGATTNLFALNVTN